MIDLHSHTWLSDGALSPQALIERAHGLNIRQLAITDHDSVGAHIALRGTPLPDGMELIPGVEISCRWENLEIHVLGLLVDVDHPALNTLLDAQLQRRRDRAAAFDRAMQRAGICGLQAYLDTLPCEAVGRMHMASFLLQHGHVRTTQQAFSKFLGSRGRLYQKAEWCSLPEAVEAIHAASGLALIAHPDRYAMSRPKFRRLLDEFGATGGDGMEVSYSNLNIDSLRFLAEECVRRKWWASVGSDFHSAENHWMDLGRIRRLPPACEARAVWHHPRWTQLASPVASAY